MTLTLPVDAAGRLVVRLYLGVGSVLRAKLTNSGEVPHPAVLVKALVDTGASRTVVTVAKAQRLGLAPTGETTALTVSSGPRGQRRTLYKVEVALAEDVTASLASNLEVMAVDDLSGLGVDALLGRDVLRTLRLTYDGPEDWFTLEVP